jgi:CubicO group peptidase (beta-lactamase class C family)
MNSFFKHTVKLIAFGFLLFSEGLMAQGNRAMGSTERMLREKYLPFSDTTQTKINKFFDRFNRIGNFNGSFLMFKNDSIIFGSRGNSIRSTRDSVYPEDIFQLASVSKVFTGISVMLLHQDGYLNIDDSVHWYLPELKRKNLSIRNLLSHTSGLPDYFYYNYKGFDLKQGQGHLVNEDVIVMVNAQPDKHFAKPGFYDYCNTNYALLSLIVERTSKQDFRSFVRENICKMADMKFTHVCNFDSLPLVNYPVQGYDNWNVFDDNMFNGTTGDKGVYSSVFEMFQLDRALRTSYILHPSTKHEMWTPATVASADGYYALGWRVRFIDGKRWVFHNGWWKGFRTYFWSCLDENKCYVVLTNNVKGSFLKTIDMVGLLD